MAIKKNDPTMVKVNAALPQAARTNVPTRSNQSTDKEERSQPSPARTPLPPKDSNNE